VNKLNKFFNFGLVSCAMLSAVTLCPGLVLAQSYSQNGGNPSIVIDKKVRPINDSTFYDNIDPNNKVFSEGEQLEFKITVTNNSQQVLYNVELADYLPKYLGLLFYPGVYDKTSNTITDKIDHLNVGESKDFYIRANVNNVPTTTLASKNILQINKACASNNVVSDCDQSQYFISAKNVPGTGASDLLVKTIGALSIAITAVGLRKFARGY
jgi:uncharacterized repeat protein (TIGR01451 family)